MARAKADFSQSLMGHKVSVKCQFLQRCYLSPLFVPLSPLLPSLIILLITEEKGLEVGLKDCEGLGVSDGLGKGVLEHGSCPGELSTEHHSICGESEGP